MVPLVESILNKTFYCPSDEVYSLMLKASQVIKTDVGQYTQCFQIQGKTVKLALGVKAFALS